jgi:YVTN family beta-propeller protein
VDTIDRPGRWKRHLRNKAGAAACFFLAALAAASVSAGAAPAQKQVQVDDRTALDLSSGCFLYHPVNDPPKSLPRNAVQRRSDSLTLDDGTVGCSWSESACPFNLDTYASGNAIDVLPEAGYPYDATMRPDLSEVWIPGASGDGVVVIDRALDTVSHRIRAGTYSISVAFSKDGSRALVSNRDTKDVTIINTADYGVAGSLLFPGSPGNLALDPVSGNFYAVEWYGPRLFEIAPDASSILNTVTLGTNLWQLVVSPDGRYIYVTDRGTDQVRVIDPATLTEVNAVSVGDDPWGLDVTADGGKLVVTCEDSSEVDIIDTGTWTVTPIPLPPDTDPRDVDILDAKNLAFVAGGLAGTSSPPDPVFVIDLAAGTVAASFEAPGWNTNVIAVQPLQSRQCPSELPPVGMLTAVKSGDDVRLDWNPLAPALDGYNVWRVSQKEDISLAHDPPGPGVSEVRRATPDPFCLDAGAAPPAAGSPFFYQVKGMCGTEGP